MAGCHSLTSSLVTGTDSAVIVKQPKSFSRWHNPCSLPVSTGVSENGSISKNTTRRGRKFRTSRSKLPYLLTKHSSQRVGCRVLLPNLLHTPPSRIKHSSFLQRPVGSRPDRPCCLYRYARRHRSRRPLLRERPALNYLHNICPGIQLPSRSYEESH